MRKLGSSRYNPFASSEVDKRLPPSRFSISLEPNGIEWVAALLSGLLLLAAAPVATAPPRIDDLHPITLRPGINRVPRFLPGGGTATIVKAWRDNGNAHGYFVWMALAGTKPGGADALIEFEGRESDPSTISASPFDGERVTADVRFATGRIAGRPASLAIEAWLNDAPSGVIADHATATIRWYKLVHREEAVGEAPDAFVAIGTLRTTKRYCNVDIALRDSAAVPLPADFEGVNQLDGCFSA